MTATTLASTSGASADACREALDVIATIALAAYSFVAALGFARVFADWQFVADVSVVVVVGHGLSLLLRRLHVAGLPAVLLTALGLVWAISWVSYPDTFAAVFPTGQTWDIAWADLGLVRDQFQDAVAPVEYVGGWSLLASIGTGFAVLTADTFAFHARARGEALVPGAVLFVFVAALGADRHRVGLTLALVAAGFLAAALLRTRFAQPPRTSLGRPRHPLTVTLPAAVVAGTAVVLGAWVLGPRLPGAGAEPLVDTHNASGGVTEVLSPLVDIRSRLVNRAATELFVVTSGAPAYWRVSGLPKFDGNTWGLPDRSLDDVDGALTGGTGFDAERAADRGRRPARQARAERSRAGAGLRRRAALERRDVDARARRPRPRGGRPLRRRVGHAELLARRPAGRQLRRARPDPIYLELPDGFPVSIVATAEEVTGAATTTYDRMLALQEWFRANFQYSLDVPQGHSTSAIEAFLRQRIGYCEQFAGTFAAMARSLGVPARVAVGYTPGVALPDGTRSVLGKNAHAWPEIWFDGLGWVPFEPTPGRGAPGAEVYTGVAAAQDDATPAPGTGGDGGIGDAPPVTLPPELIPSDPLLDESLVVPTGPTGPVYSTRVVDRPVDWATVGIVLLLATLAVLAPSIVRRWRRAHPSTDVARQVAALWRRALSAVEATGCRIDPALTPLEQARSISPRLPVAARPLRALAEVATAATYATPDEIAHLTDAQIAGEPGPRRWCRQVERIAEDSMTTSGRFRRYFTVWN